MFRVDTYTGSDLHGGFKPGLPRAMRSTACVTALAAGLLLAGCSVKQVAIRQFGSALADSTGGAFAAESDVEFAGQAVPFSLKLIESLLLEQPENPDLLLAAASGFTQYSFVWVHQQADFLEEEDFAEAMRQRGRARAFYIRAHDYAIRGLEVRHPGFRARFVADPEQAVTVAGIDDVPLLYWAAASLGSAISLGKTEPELIARQSQFAALARRAFALDPGWQDGTVRELLMAYEMARPAGGPEAKKRARELFEQTVEESGGRRAGVFVTYAEAACVQQQDRAEFVRLIERALAIDPAQTTENRLANIVMQTRARWLLGRIDELFLE